MLRLQEGLRPKYDPSLHSKLPEPTEVKTALEFARATSERMQLEKEQEEKPDLNKLVDSICDGTKKKKSSHYPA